MFFPGISIMNIEMEAFKGYIYPNLSEISNETYGIDSQSIHLPSQIFQFTENTTDGKFYKLKR